MKERWRPSWEVRITSVCTEHHYGWWLAGWWEEVIKIQVYSSTRRQTPADNVEFVCQPTTIVGESGAGNVCWRDDGLIWNDALSLVYTEWLVYFCGWKPFVKGNESVFVSNICTEDVPAASKKLKVKIGTILMMFSHFHLHTLLLQSGKKEGVLLPR